MMMNNQINFNIETLDGESFYVNIPRTHAEKYWGACGDNPYAKYGLDYLQEAICGLKGIDPVSQQLIADDILTIETPLIQLENKVIRLIIIPEFSIHLLQVSFQFKLIYSNLDWLAQQYSRESCRRPTIGYLRNDDIIPVIGIIRAKCSQIGGYFKIKGENISSSILTNVYGEDKEMPEYVWLEYDKNSIKIPPHIEPYL
jgi:hypothetical protein